MKKEPVKKNAAAVENAPEKNNFSLKDFLVGGSSRRGTIAMVSSAIVIALVIILNMILGGLPSSALEIDISSQDIYTVSDISQEFLADLDQDIEILILAENGNVDERISKFIDNYASLSEHIIVTEMDPVLYPSVLDAYECEADHIVVRNVSNDKFTTIPFRGGTGSIITETIDANYSIVEDTFDADGQITSAINCVISETTVTAYVLEGHNESNVSDTVLNAVAKSNLVVSEDPVNLLADGGLPEDCQMLIINNPTVDLADEELDMIRTFMQAGGKLVLIIEQLELNNFNALMYEYGYELQEGWLGDYTNYYAQYFSAYRYFCFSPRLDVLSEVTKGIDITPLVLQPRGMLEVEPARATIETENFITATGDTLLYIDENNVTEGGTYVIGGKAIETTTNENGETVTSTLTIISTASLADETVVSSLPNISNLDIMVNALTVDFEGLDNIFVPAKSLMTVQNTVTAGGLWGVIFAGLIPVAIIVGGLLFWIKRRRR